MTGPQRELCNEKCHQMARPAELMGQRRWSLLGREQCVFCQRFGVPSGPQEPDCGDLLWTRSRVSLTGSE